MYLEFEQIMCTVLFNWTSTWQMCVLLVLIRVSTSCHNPPYSQLHGTHCVCVAGSVCAGSRCSHAKHVTKTNPVISMDVSGFKISACPDCTCRPPPFSLGSEGGINVIRDTQQIEFHVNSALGVGCETSHSHPIQNKDVCVFAATELGLNFHSAAMIYSHWGPGCFKHNDAVYFNLDLSAFHSKTQDNLPGHATICAVATRTPTNTVKVGAMVERAFLSSHIALFKAQRDLAAAEQSTSEIFQPFSKAYPIGMPLQPACCNFSNSLHIPCASIHEICREYECFPLCTHNYKRVSCKSSFSASTHVHVTMIETSMRCPASTPICTNYRNDDQLGVCMTSTGGPVVGMCPADMPACLPQGYCVPWRRVEYQAYQEERDQRVLFSHNSCRGEQDYADVRPQERQFDTICTTAQKPLCLGSQTLHHKPATGVTGQCAPVYPSHHHTLWASWQVATLNTNGNSNTVMSAFQDNIFKYVTSSQKGKEMLERMDIGTTVSRIVSQQHKSLSLSRSLSPTLSHSLLLLLLLL